MRTFDQFVRYGVIGIVSNSVLYVAYLGLTYVGVGHKTSATIAYALGVLQTFLFNRSWSFRDSGAGGPALARYIAAYVSGYLLNIAVLIVLVNRAGFPHWVVQGAMIIVLAMGLFLIQKLWVFQSQV